MGCGGSKVDDLPLVTLCRERKEFVKAASDHRYALASAHVSYFRSLKDVGDALRKFVDEELVVGVASSPSDSPVLTLPSDLGKRKKKNKGRKDNGGNDKSSSSSTSISHSVSHNHSPEDKVEEGEEGKEGHLHFSDSELDSESGHIHFHDSPELEAPFSSYTSPPGVNSYTYYMKKSPTMPSVVYEDPRGFSPNRQWPESSYAYSSYSNYGNGGFFGFSMGSPSGDVDYSRQSSAPQPPPAPPSPPKVSAWDFLNPFDSYDNGYSGYYSQGGYGFGSRSSSPDSKEVREREGIPDLEEETEREAVMNESHKEKKLDEQMKRNSGEGTSKAVPPQYSEGTSGGAPSQNSEGKQVGQGKEIKSSPETSIGSKSSEEEYARKKGVSFEVDEASTIDAESSKPSSLTTLSTHGTRDLQEVIKEIRDEFETAFGHGKEVSLLLEVDKLPYRPSGTVFKVIFSRILYLIPSMSSSHPPTGRSVRLASSTMKMAKTYYGDHGKNFNMKTINLASTLEKLFVWEKKLYKEVKDEERLRVAYERKCKRLKILDDRGVESNKIDALQASIKKLLTKIDVNIRTIDAISSRIHKLRDEELQPQLTELIHGLIRMWKSMLKCHQKQFQAIMESKTRTLKANTGFQRDSSVRATAELESELLNWSTRFSDWINTQKSYVRSLNEWLLRCLVHEEEETPDGIIPFSPGRIEAPQVFIICNDWYQAMERISVSEVENAMHDFAFSLHELWERQDDEQRQRTKAEYLLKDFEKRLKTFRVERGKMEHNQDALSDKTAVSKVPSESGVSPLDDLKVDLDTMRKRLEEERARHKEAVKLVHHAASSSIQAGLIPIFEALGNFTSDTLKAHEQVRILNAGVSQGT